MQKYDIHYVELDGVGSEQKGRRPCVIIQNNTGNKFSPTTIVVPVTNKPKNKIPTHLEINEDFIKGIILCEQIRVVDKCRVGVRLGSLSEKYHNSLNEKLKISLDMEN